MGKNSFLFVCLLVGWLVTKSMHEQQQQHNDDNVDDYDVSYDNDNEK